MIRKIFTFALAGLLLNLLCAAPHAVAAAEKQSKEAKQTAKVKSLISKLGTGKDARVAVKLKDKTELKGFVSEAGGEQFILTDEQTGASTPVMYAQVEKVKWMPMLSSVAKKNFTVKQMAKHLLIGIAGALALTMVVCVVSQECQN
jgi:hypothetical protein